MEKSRCKIVAEVRVKNRNVLVGNQQWVLIFGRNSNGKTVRRMNVG